MILKSLLKVTLLLSLFSSCEELVKATDNDYFTVSSGSNKIESVKLFFSHNINGETHPCGCRKFPLGGLVQIAAYMHEVQKKSPTIYVDTGDLLFASTTIPESLSQSIHFTAKKLIEVKEKLGLKLFLPGDQDFASGKKYIEDLSRKSSINFLISNLKTNSKIKHLKVKEINLGKRKLIFLSVANPDLYISEFKKDLDSPSRAIERELTKIKKDPNNLIILMSHSGLEFDKSLAIKFPRINLIIGAHSQAFLTKAITVGKTKIVQVLSRNHYLGEIDIPLAPEKEITYSLINMTDERKNLWPDSPYINWLNTYKKELDEINTIEQKQMSSTFAGEDKAPTYQSCMECHQAQGEFWQTTAHATSFHTLIKSKASNNPKCIGCHSLDFQKKSGFSNKENIVRGEKFTQDKHDKYWKEIDNVFKKATTSIREMDSSKRLKLAKEWHKIDRKFEVQYNNANVQCLNCHDKAYDHPFTIDEKKPKVAEKTCYQCHTPDQSPEWYKGSEGHSSDKFNPLIIKERFKLISCPKNKND